MKGDRGREPKRTGGRGVREDGKRKGGKEGARFESSLVTHIFSLSHTWHNQGRSQDFSKGGGHTVSNIIAMALLLRNIVGCLVKKGLQRGGGGVTGTPGPLLTTPLIIEIKEHNAAWFVEKYHIFY